MKTPVCYRKTLFDDGKTGPFQAKPLQSKGRSVLDEDPHLYNTLLAEYAS